MGEVWARRSFMTGLSTALAAFGLGSGTAAAAPETNGNGFTPVRHKEDEWFDSLPGKHRVFVDTATAEGASEGLRFARNIFTGNKEGYGLADADLAMIVCLRHGAAVYGFDDAMWAKYGHLWSATSKLKSSKAKDHPTTNELKEILDELTGKGVMFAVCNLSAKGRSRAAVEAKMGEFDAIYKELTSHMIPRSRLVPAGVVAATRAQEYGYSLLVST